MPLLRGHGPLVSDAEREAAVAALRRASVDGRLGFDELEARAERAELARGRRDLATLLADLPPAPPETEAGRERAVLSRLRRGGRWTPAGRSRYTTVLGSIDLDLRRAELPGPEVDLELAAYFGSIRLHAPPGVEVRVQSRGLACGCDVRLDGTPPPGAPVIRVHTRGLAGSVRVRRDARLLETLAAGALRLARLRGPGRTA